ncbi:SDR family oxidoreductase [Rhodococcus sp. D2-41]|nr:SDR family oxidoreductase [Rhodococcus sp. D2-41]
MSELFRLDGKVAVVTGGGRGIGKMITEGLLSAGATVYISGRKVDELESTVAELESIGPIHAIPADLGTESGVSALAGELVRREAAIHLLFNNAGTNWGAPLEQFPASAWDKVLALNVKGAFLLTQALLPLLRAASTPEDPERVVMTGSVDGLRAPEPGYNNFSYSASKAAVHMLTQQMAGELAPDILVNAIAPGLFESKMTAGILAVGSDAVGQQIPLRRIGRPEDMAGIAVFLAGRASTYLTGAVIPVDGGVLATR